MRHLVVGGLLAGIVLALYSPVLSHGFVNYDDDVYIVANPRLADGLTAANIRWAFTTPYHSNWHPLTWLSWFADVELFGVSPAAFHRTDMLLHTANAILLYALLFIATQGLTPQKPTPSISNQAPIDAPTINTQSTAGSVPFVPAVVSAALAALLFAVHPLRVESVAWASERKDVLSAFFALAATLAYVHYAKRIDARRYALAALLFVFALLAKPMVVTLPVLWLVLDYWPLGRLQHTATRRRAVLEKLPLLTVSAAIALVTVTVQGESGAVRNGDQIAWIDRLAHVPTAYATYLEQTVWPVGLSVFYPHPGGAWAWTPMLAFTGMLVLITACCIALRRRWPWLLTGWCWFIIALLPVIGLIQTGAQSHADRYTYLPHVGLAIIVAAAVAALFSAIRSPARIVCTAIILAAAIALAAVTVRMIAVWETSHRLFAQALAVTENNHVAHNNFGVAIRANQPLLARQQFKAALAIEPDYYDARMNLGTSYFRAGDFDAAMQEYLAALALDGTRPAALTNLGLTLVRLNRLDEAIEAFKQALNRAPADALTRMFLADALFMQENWVHAAAQYDIALQLNPNLNRARHNRDIALTNLDTEK